MYGFCLHKIKWIWEQWQWRGTPNFPKLQHYWNLTIRLFSVISKTLVGSGCLVLSFCRNPVSLFYSPGQLAFVGFLLSKDAFFMLSHFSLTAIDFQGTLYLVLVLVNIHLNATSIWTVTNFSYLSFGVCFSDVSRRGSNLFFLQLPYTDF